MLRINLALLIGLGLLGHGCRTSESDTASASSGLGLSADLCVKAGAKKHQYGGKSIQVNWCVFGKALIEEWTLGLGADSAAARAYQQAPATNSDSAATAATTYCVSVGGMAQKIADKTGSEIGTCLFPDNSMIEEWTLYRGAHTTDTSLAPLLAPVQSTHSPITPMQVSKVVMQVSPTSDPRLTAKPPVYPDKSSTPGVAIPGVTAAQVCTPNYTATVRHVTDADKHAVFARYQIPFLMSLYEVDHFISLELGGSNDIGNLWPEPYQLTPGAREKDVVETSLHRRICAGQLTLQQAQAIITGDWYAEFRKIKGISNAAVLMAPSSSDND